MSFSLLREELNEEKVRRWPLLHSLMDGLQEEEGEELMEEQSRENGKENDEEPTLLNNSIIHTDTISLALPQAIFFDEMNYDLHTKSYWLTVSPPSRSLYPPHLTICGSISLWSQISQIFDHRWERRGMSVSRWRSGREWGQSTRYYFIFHDVQPNPREVFVCINNLIISNDLLFFPWETRIGRCCGTRSSWLKYIDYGNIQWLGRISYIEWIQLNIYIENNETN